MSDALLQVRGLTKDYHDGERLLQVLRGVDCSFRQGEAVAIVGQSGSGKSTLLNLIGALDRPTTGKILLRGDDLAGMGAARLDQVRREQIGLVFQFHHLIPELRAWENVALPATIAGRSAADARKKALDLLDRVGLADRVNHVPSKLSGGEQQRVALARALVNDPVLLLADEPTGNLDEEMGRQVIDLMWEMTRKRDRTLLIVTHEKAVSDSADRVLRLDHGHLRQV